MTGPGSSLRTFFRRKRPLPPVMLCDTEEGPEEWCWVEATLPVEQARAHAEQEYHESLPPGWYLWHDGRPAERHYLVSEYEANWSDRPTDFDREGIAFWRFEVCEQEARS